MLGTSCREHKTNEYVWQQVNFLARHQELFCSERRKLSLFGYVLRRRCATKNHSSVDGSHRRVKLHKSWTDNIKEWTGQLFRRCCASQTTEVDKRPVQLKRLSEYSTTLGRHRC